MDNREYKLNEAIWKSLVDGFRALNVNISDCAKSLRTLAEMSSEKKNDSYWHPVFGSDGEDPRPKYDWVLVKIRDDPKILKGSNYKFYDLPHIAELRSDGKWWPLEWDEPYGSETVPFEVMYWRPIPGDGCDYLYANNKIVKRIHHYE